MATVTSLIPLQVYNKIHIQSLYSGNSNLVKLSLRFISPENIIILSVLSDDFLDVRLDIN